MIFSILPFSIYLCFLFLIFTLEFIFLTDSLGFFESAFLCFNVSYVIFVPILVKFLADKIFKNSNLKRCASVAISIFFTFFYHFYLFLLIYRLRTGYSFYWSFLWFNKHDAFVTIFRIFGITSWLFVIALPICIFIFFHFSFKKTFEHLGNKNLFIKIVILAIIFNLFFVIFSPVAIKGEMVKFVYKNFFTNLEIENNYLENYNKYFNEAVFQESKAIDNFQTTILGEQIFFIHLESVSSFFINESVTPNLWKETKRGIFFSNLLNSSIQTLRCQESILCGLPPALKDTINNNFGRERLNEIACLPRLLKQQGFRTLFFKDDDLDFSKTGDFMLDIGFDEVHNEDIMRPGDPESEWGFREDIFYKRVFEYLEKNYANQKIFVYIASSSTNHIPFKVADERYKKSIPYLSCTNAKELISNTVYIQDIYLGELYNYLEKYRNSATVMTFNDHAWPIGIHPGNTFNEYGAYQENFSSFWVWTPPQSLSENYQPSHLVRTFSSQMDIFPTILELIKQPTGRYLGNSLASEILNNYSANSGAKNIIITVQPYSGGLIDVIDYPNKYIFDVANNSVSYFNLDDDWDEKNPTIYNQPDKYFYLISDFFNFNESAYVK